VYNTGTMDFINTKHKGDFAVAQCVAKLYSKGYEVLFPLGDRKLYDLVVDDGTTLKKVQCKYAGFSVSEKGHVVELRTTGGNKSRNSYTKYTDEAFDLLYVYTASGKQYLINWKEITCRSSLNVDYDKYSKFEI